MNTELEQCDEVLKETCGKFYNCTMKPFSIESALKEYAESQMILNPKIFENAMKLTSFVENMKRKYLK